MKIGIEKYNQAGLQLSSALLIYGDSLVMQHGIAHGNDGKVSLGEGKPLSVKALAQLAKPFEAAHPVEFFQPEILARTPDLMVWECRATPRTMHYGAYLPELDDKTYPQPPLVWAVRSDGRVFVAAHSGKRPNVNTPLLMAPYWNVDGIGTVCWGQGRRPDVIAPHATWAWEACFYESVFSHPNRGTKLAPGVEFVAMWRTAHERGRFDLKNLAPMGQTLGEWLMKGVAK